MAGEATLRPVERRVLQMAESGVDDVEIAWRFRRTPRFVKQVKALAATQRPPSRREPQLLRPIERRVLLWREAGLSHEELAPRFRRSPEFLEQVERLAHHKLRVVD